MDYIKTKALAILFAVGMILGAFFVGFHYGEKNEKTDQLQRETVLIKKVDEKNDKVQEVANKADEAQIVYKDRVVTEYKTITREVYRYVYKENSSGDVVWLNADFVRLHNDAVDAGNGEVKVTGDASNTEGTNPKAGEVAVKSGDVLKILTSNYAAYASCRIQLKGALDFYETVKSEVNK